MLKIELSKTGRPFYRFYGVAYNQLIHGKNPTKKISANLHDRDSYYYDDAVRLSTHDLQSFGNLAGKPICVEHDQNFVVGEVTHQWVDDHGKVRITGRVYTDTPEGREKAEQLARGEFRGLSVGYSASLMDGFDGSTNVAYKEFDEISLCKEPFFQGCQISVAASRKQESEKKNTETNAPTYKTNAQKVQDKNRIWIDIMASNPEQTEQQPTPEPQQDTAAEKNTQGTNETSATSAAATEMEKTTTTLSSDVEQQELLKATDQLVFESKELREQYEKAEEERRKAEIVNEQLKGTVDALMKRFADQMEPELEMVLQTYKEANGGQVPKAFQEDLTATFLNPDENVQQYAKVIGSAAKMNNDLKAQNQKLQDQLNALSTQVKRLQDAQNAATLSLNASRASLSKVAAAATATSTGNQQSDEEALTSAAELEDDVRRKTSVQASANDDLIYAPAPGKADVPFMALARRTRIGVNASADNNGRLALPKAPVHAHMLTDKGELTNPNSARYSKNPANRALFSFLSTKGYMPSGFIKLRGDEQDHVRESLGAQ